jgi:predicted transcriptional regulator
MHKCTMTLNLSEKEMAVLSELAEKKGMSKTALMRQALRLYQAIDVKQERGERLIFESSLSKAKIELLVV